MADRFQATSCDLFQNSELITKGPPDQYRLITTRSNLNDEGSVRKWTFLQEDLNIENKIILMVGETGAGKTTLINSLVNHILGVKFTDHIWFQITDQKADCLTDHRDKITVYEVFPQESQVSLTIIDTPGYGDTDGTHLDENITKNLYKLFNHETGVKELDAVCLVLKASTNRLSDRLLYIFDAVLSLFDKNIENNIVIFVTHSDGGPPTNAINAIKKAKIPCRKDEENDPVCFLVNNRQTEKINPKYKRALKSAWELTEENLKDFLVSLNEHKSTNLEQTKNVLKEQERLQAFINNVQERIKYIEDKSQELKEIKNNFKENKEKMKRNEEFTLTVTTYYKEKVLIEDASWWDRMATCCSVCEENCHKQCWFTFNPEGCYVMKNDHCTVCTHKCHYTKHVSENKKYITCSREEKMSFNEIKNKYGGKESSDVNIKFSSKAFQKTEKELESTMNMEEEFKIIEKNMNEEITVKNNEKNKLMEEAGDSISKLCKISLKPDSAFIVKSTEFFIQRAEESGKNDLVQKLKNLKINDPGSQQRAQSAASYFSKLQNLLKK